MVQWKRVQDCFLPRYKMIHVMNLRVMILYLAFLNVIVVIFLVTLPGCERICLPCHAGGSPMFNCPLMLTLHGTVLLRLNEILNLYYITC